MKLQDLEGHILGVSRHGFRSAAEVALAKWESANRGNPPDEPLHVVFFIRAENPVHDYIAALEPPPGS